jgi:hypothetical protein
LVVGTESLTEAVATVITRRAIISQHLRATRKTTGTLDEVKRYLFDIIVQISVGIRESARAFVT